MSTEPSDRILPALPMEFLRAVLLTLAVALITGIIYPLVITGVAQAVFHDQAQGSLISKNGEVVGSRLIGQEFTDPKYFQGRPSATLNDAGTKPQPYNADNSTGSNLAPSNKALVDRVAASVAAFRTANNLGPNDPVPVDIVTTDFSGFDPDITEASALLQVNRVAAARNLDPARVKALVEQQLQGRYILVFGEPHVNVLLLNMALDGGAAG
ncbi:MAG TPA: potassium-transporting ATPase subunit KdpC [Candidatus Sulfotelmatobacter sp.]|nr:potassium-transporting ATPase subunit KdpC [Candidatus Sulfotelmatobacter sp.]